MRETSLDIAISNLTIIANIKNRDNSAIFGVRVPTETPLESWQLALHLYSRWAELHDRKPIIFADLVRERHVSKLSVDITCIAPSCSFETSSDQ